MLRKLIFAGFLILFAAVTSAAGQDLKIGYMNPQEVLNQIPERVEVEKQLSAFMEEKRAELQQKSSEFQQAVAEYQQQVSALSQQQQQQREQQLSTMEQELVELQDSIRQQYSQRQSELMAPIYNRMDQAIADVAQENNFNFVFNETTSYGDNIVYYAASDILDITQEVLDRMNSDSAQSN